MAAFDFTSNFNACPVGPFINANKHLAWTDPAIVSISDNDPSGVFYSIVAGGKNGGQCCRTRYPAGAGGTGNQRYSIQLGKPGLPINLEFDMMFEPGFDMSLGAGKPGPQIQWGSTASGPTGGVRLMYIWSSAAARPVKPFNPILQDQRNGNQLVWPPFYTADIQFGRWYHWHFKMMGGPAGFAEHYLDGVKLATTIVGMGNSHPGDPVEIDFTFFANNGPPVDVFARHDNVRVYSSPLPFPDAGSHIATFTKGN